MSSADHLPKFVQSSCAARLMRTARSFHRPSSLFFSSCLGLQAVPPPLQPLELRCMRWYKCFAYCTPHNRDEVSFCYYYYSYVIASFWRILLNRVCPCRHLGVQPHTNFFLGDIFNYFCLIPCSKTEQGIIIFIYLFPFIPLPCTSCILAFPPCH